MSSASQGGALTNLIAIGAADLYLSIDPSITFFRFRYNKYTNFACEAIEQQFASQVQFGGDCQLTLNRTGDLVYYMYCVIDIPGIKAVPNNQVCGFGSPSFPCDNPCDPANDGDAPVPGSGCCDGQTSSTSPDLDTYDPYDSCVTTEGPWCHWTNAIGQFLIKRASLVIGGQVVSNLYNHFLFMWEELAGKPGKRLTELIGKRFTRPQLIADSMEDRRLYVPLPFWFTKASGNALPLVSLQFHSVQVHVQFEDLVNCIQASDYDVAVIKTSNCQPITSHDLSARLLCTYVYLDVQERDRFANGSFEQLIDQVQQFSIQSKQSQLRLNLNFNHPIIELMWAVQRKKQAKANNHFNYSGKWGKDPVKSVQLKLNSLPRFSQREGRYFRLVEPYQAHTLIPESFTYCYSFALFPEEAQPSGSMNSSRIDNVELILDLQDELGSSDEEVTVMVYARNWNVFRYKDGLGGPAFAS